MGRLPKYNHDVILMDPMPAKGQAVVYIFADVEDKAVYVGSSRWLADRIKAHRRSAWWLEAHHLYIEACESIEAMLDREIQLIHTTNPTFNRTHKPIYVKGVATCCRCEWDEANGYWSEMSKSKQEMVAALDAALLRRPE